jgi:hypothetical protein
LANLAASTLSYAKSESTSSMGRRSASSTIVVSCGETCHALATGSVAIEQNGKIEARRFNETVDTNVHIGDRTAEHFQATVASRGKAAQRRQFLTARLVPGREEINHHGLAALGPKRDLCAVNIRQHECRRADSDPALEFSRGGRGN